MPHPEGRSPHQLRRRKKTITGHFVPEENTRPPQEAVLLHTYFPENGDPPVTLGREGVVTGKTGQYAALVCYFDAESAREARQRLERAATTS